MKNISNEISWLDRDIKRYKEIGMLIPNIQRSIYEKISKHWCTGKTVVDVGCSIGLGSNILSHNARHVWGIDINEESIGFAEHIFSRPNLEFAVMDIEKVPERPLSNFEIVVCMEVLEHLPDFYDGLSNLKGFFSNQLNTIGFLTIPNLQKKRVAEKDAINELHVNHWQPGEMYGILIEHFNFVTMFSNRKIERWGQDETFSSDDAKSEIVVYKVEGLK
jgi:SAM-dependent methyltransferase